MHTNVAVTFLNIIKKHFPQHNILHRVFNKKSVKGSYSCLPNMKSVINKHNSKVLRSTKVSSADDKPMCNCRVKSTCPMSGACLHSSIIYAADVIGNQSTKTYIGLTSNQFKTRFNNHKKSFSNPNYEKESELSKYVWSLKRGEVNFEIKWRVVKRAPTTRSPDGNCNLCLEEKVAIVCTDRAYRLNRRSELVSKCRHRSLQQYPPDRDR